MGHLPFGLHLLLPLFQFIVLEGVWSTFVAYIFIVARFFHCQVSMSHPPHPPLPSKAKIMAVMSGSDREGSRMIRYSSDPRNCHPGYKANDISSTLSERRICESTREMSILPTI